MYVCPCVSLPTVTSLIMTSPPHQLHLCSCWSVFNLHLPFTVYFSAMFISFIASTSTFFGVCKSFDIVGVALSSFYLFFPVALQSFIYQTLYSLLHFSMLHQSATQALGTFSSPSCTFQSFIHLCSQMLSDPICTCCTHLCHFHLGLSP